jgi:hypothetical protein
MSYYGKLSTESYERAVTAQANQSILKPLLDKPTRVSQQ